MNEETSSARSALIAGATGLVGGFLLRRLVEDPRYCAVHALVRRSLNFEHPKLREHRVDFDHLENHPEAFAVDDVFCALGTTIKKAGSEEAFRRVDLLYVESMARLARQAGAERFMLISSIGADASASNFYLSVKGAAEDAVAACGYPELHIMRPSLLLGNRGESRPGERLAIFASKLAAPLLVGPVRPYRPVRAKTVAGALLGAAHTHRAGLHVYTYADLTELAADSRRRPQ